MLFDASTVYAPGEPRGNVGYSNYQNMDILGRYDLSSITKNTNLLVGLAAFVVLIFIVHRAGKK